MPKSKDKNQESSQSSITYPRGFQASGVTCGLKASGASDLAIIVADDICQVAAVFTKSKMPGAPVLISKKHVANGKAKAIICNSGVSNVCTGKQGLADALEMCRLVSNEINAKTQEVLVCSTGVIGPQLNMQKITQGISLATQSLSKGKIADHHVAQAILTTDLVPKAERLSVKITNKNIRFGGVAKGSGMIAPNMATMLSFITTDAHIDSTLLKKALKDAAAMTFNRISVDHDTSTSDTVIVMASGQAGNTKITRLGQSYDLFFQGLLKICQKLAYAIVKDGEGATKVYRVKVSRARSVKDADKVGKTVVGSPLVKTAIFGADPNWGRIVMAVGRSGAVIKPEKLSISIGGIKLCLAGEPIHLSATKSKKLKQIMQQKEILIAIDLGLGTSEAQWLGCDLSYQYVRINAEYTT